MERVIEGYMEPRCGRHGIVSCPYCEWRLELQHVLWTLEDSGAYLLKDGSGGDPDVCKATDHLREVVQKLGGYFDKGRFETMKQREGR